MFGLTRRNQDISTYNPWREMEEFEKAFFGRPFGSFFDTPAFAQFRTDVTDEGDHYLLEADLPGFEKKDITLDIQNDTLIVRAERKSKVEEKDKKDKVIRMERSYGSYTRSFDISGVDADKIKAKYVDGVLRLTLPKLEQRLPERQTPGNRISHLTETPPGSNPGRCCFFSNSILQKINSAFTVCLFYHRTAEITICCKNTSQDCSREVSQLGGLIQFPDVCLQAGAVPVWAESGEERHPHTWP